MGRSKYGISRTYRVLMDLLTVTFLKQYGDRPQHAFGYFGVAMFGGGVLIDGYLAALLLGTLMIIAGIQLPSIGLLSEVMARTYYESQGKPRYRIREIVGE